METNQPTRTAAEILVELKDRAENMPLVLPGMRQALCLVVTFCEAVVAELEAVKAQTITEPPGGAPTPAPPLDGVITEPPGGAPTPAPGGLE